MHDPIVSDTNRYHNQLARQQEIHESCEKEVAKWTDHELIDYIKDYCSDAYYDFIMENLRLLYCKLSGRDPNIMRTKLGGIPNLLIELFQPENYLAYFWDLDPDEQTKVREIVIEHYADKKINEDEECNT